MVYQIGTWEIEKEPYCDGCVDAAIDATKTVMYYDGHEKMVEYHIKCENLDKCRRIANRIRNKEELA